MTTGDYAAFMEAQQQINFAIKAEFDKRRIEFPYNTQTVYLRGQTPALR